MIKVVNCLWCNSDELTLFAHRKDGVGIVKCDKCKLVMTDHIPEDPSEFYQEDYYNVPESHIETGMETGYAGSHYLISPAFLFWQNALIEELNEAHSPSNFLEIGCATGNLLQILKENQTNLNLTGIDISEYAVDVCKQKKFEAQVATIEQYKAKPKLDIIFSSETMEHLDNLKSFLGGVSKNLKEDGVFLFYVPSISEKDAERENNEYIRFNVNMEHLLHFSPEFLKQELPAFFNTNVLIKEFKTGFGPSIIGAVSKKKIYLKNLEKLFTALEKEQIPNGSTGIFLRNLMIFSIKFGQFDFAEKILSQIEKRKMLGERDRVLLRALTRYHKGELEKANIYFQEYLKLSPTSQVAIQLLLANERELHKVHHSTYQNQIVKIQEKLTAAETELDDLKKSKIVGTSIKLRHTIGKAISKRSSNRNQG